MDPTTFIETLPCLLLQLVEKGKWPEYIIGNEIATFVYLLIMEHFTNFKPFYDFCSHDIIKNEKVFLTGIRHACKLLNDGFLDNIKSINLSIGKETMELTFPQLVKHFGFAGAKFGTGICDGPELCKNCTHHEKMESMQIISRYVTSIVMQNGVIYSLIGDDGEYHSNHFKLTYIPATLKYNEEIFDQLKFLRCI